MAGLECCHHCGTLTVSVNISASEKAVCGNCGAELYRGHADTLDTPLAFCVAALLLFALANLFPLLSFEMEGRRQVSHLISGTTEFWHQGYGELALVVAVTSIIAPLVNLLSLLYVLTPLKLGFTAPGATHVFKLVTFTRPWAMLDVLLLGLLVALVKLSDMADLEALSGFYAYAVVILFMSVANATLSPHAIWRLLSPKGFVPAHPDHHADLVAAGYLSCNSCGHVMAQVTEADRCPRCRTRVTPVEAKGLSAAWAYLIAAAIFYIPANIYPVMTVIFFGQGNSDTILSGVIHLAEAGDWPIALLVFIASVFVPILKIIVLGGIYASVQLDTDWCRKERTKLFQMTEAIGRWSMIDIFMVSILASLVKLDAVATVEPGFGAVAFCAVVILTMMSAMSFDPKQMWLPAIQDRTSIK